MKAVNAVLRTIARIVGGIIRGQGAGGPGPVNPPPTDPK
jgi:hypothetical protein